MGLAFSYQGDIVVADRLSRWVRLSDTALVSHSFQQQMTFAQLPLSYCGRD